MPAGPFQIYLPLIDHEAINTSQSFRVITAQVNDNKTGVQRETGPVLDKCWAVHSHNPKSSPWIYSAFVQPAIKDPESPLKELFSESSNKFRNLPWSPAPQPFSNPGFMLLPPPVTGPVLAPETHKTAQETCFIARFRRLLNKRNTHAANSM